MVRMLHIRYLKEESIMDILNIVFSALNLLATVVIGVINVTWMISRDVFRNKPRAKHDSKNKMARKMTAHSSYTLAVIFSRKMCC